MILFYNCSMIKDESNTEFDVFVKFRIILEGQLVRAEVVFVMLLLQNPPLCSSTIEAFKDQERLISAKNFSL